MKAIEKLKSIFKKAPVIVKTPVHEHEWKTQYTTGRWDSVWTRDGKQGIGPSFVVKCDCGQWAVRHAGDSVYVLLSND